MIKPPYREGKETPAPVASGEPLKVKQVPFEHHKNIEDAFVENYLLREGETLSEAKVRLQQQQKERMKRFH